MQLIIGLGNKNAGFKSTPHNVGAEAVKIFVKQTFNGSFSLNKKLSALIYQEKNTIYAIPYCYMNESGRIVKNLVKYFNAQLNDLLVVHDDTDLLLGNFKIQKNRGPAGHKGVESIIKILNSKGFWRLRIGVRRKEIKAKAIDIVLKKFSKKERGVIEGLHPNINKTIKEWVNKH